MPNPKSPKLRAEIEAQIKQGIRLKDLAAKYSGKVSQATINNWSRELRKPIGRAGKSVNELLKQLREAIRAEVKEELKARLN